MLMESGIAERKVFIQSFVKEIMVTGREAILHYTVPPPPERLIQDSESSVLAIGTNGTLGPDSSGQPSRLVGTLVHQDRKRR